VISFIKWSGSKRSQSKVITSEIRSVNFKTYYEPFVGGGSIYGSLKPKKATISDAYKPLVDLWILLRDDPEVVISTYKKNWLKLQSQGHTYFTEVRTRFNKDKDPLDLLFLSRTCVNGLIRFNKKGEFNNTLHHSRPGMHPDRFEKIAMEWSEILVNTSIGRADYRKATASAVKGDLIYLDPPYFNNKDRYLENIDHELFVDYLRDLNSRSIKFVLSYDGFSESKAYTHNIPSEIYKRKLNVKSGLSAFKKVQDKKSDLVHESLYLNF